MIFVHDLRKAYGSLVAVDGVSFAVQRGETFGLLGPNGAGKTTTLMMLTGGLKPDAGRVELDGDGDGDPTRPAARRRMGVAPQSLAVYDNLSAEENLRFFGRMYDLRGSKLAERVDWALDLAGLAERRRDRAGTYSGGMKRRLNLACALIHDPELVFFDEPTVGVDPQSRNHLIETINQLAEQGRTIIYTTHYMEEAQRLCRRVAIMDHGRILAIDTVSGLIDQFGGESSVEATLAPGPRGPAALPGPVVGGVLRFNTDRPFDEAARLAAAGVRFDSFHVERPNLEGVFLHLTGKSLRD